MPMKSQCEDHGCSELLCGCPISTLESDGDFHEILRAKDRWINKLLGQIDALEVIISGETTIKIEHEVSGCLDSYMVIEKEGVVKYFKDKESGRWDE